MQLEEPRTLQVDESEQLDDLEKEISHRLGFSTKTHRLQITAHCEEFQKLGTCKKRGE